MVIPILVSIVACQPAPSPTATPTAVPAPTSTPSAPPTPSPRPLVGRIAYVHDTSGDGVPVNDIWIVDAAGGTPRQVTNDPRNESAPFWLLDGSRIVFAQFDYSTNPYYGRLISVLPDGSDRTDLAPVANYGTPAVSPDGRYVAWGGGGARDGTDGITLLDRSTGTASLFTKDGDTDPIWSPDGTALLTREPQLGGVAVVEVPSGRVTRFKHEDVAELGGWTADGGSIWFRGPDDTASTPTWMAPRAGGPIVDLPGQAELARPAWTSPDGRWIVDAGLGVTSGDGSALPRFEPDARLVGGTPSWSPDSLGFTFAGEPIDVVGVGSGAIYVVRTDTGDVVTLTSGSSDSEPCWGSAR